MATASKSDIESIAEGAGIDTEPPLKRAAEGVGAREPDRSGNRLDRLIGQRQPLTRFTQSQVFHKPCR